jgi:hypothetical protein
MARTTAAQSIPVNKTSTAAHRSTGSKRAHPHGAIGPSTPPSNAYPALHRPPQHPPAWVLAITLDRKPLALRSTRIIPRTAVRRGAAGAVGRPSNFLVVREAVSRWQVAPPPRRHGCQSRGAVHRNTVGRPTVAAAGRSGPGGADAGRVFVTVSTSSAGVRCPVSGASVQWPRVPVHATAVQCPMRTSERPGVRRPVWASGVHPFPRPLRPTGGRGGRRWGRQPHGWDSQGRRGRLPCPRPPRRLPESEPGDRGWRRPCWPAEASAWTWPSSWEVVEQWLGRPPGRCEPPWLDCDVRSRPRRGRNMQ